MYYNLLFNHKIQGNYNSEKMFKVSLLKIIAANETKFSVFFQCTRICLQ